MLDKEHQGRNSSSEYYHCAHRECNARLIRVTPNDGTAPFFKPGHDAQHHLMCLADPQDILVKQARQELLQVAVQSTVGGTAGQPIRAHYDTVGSLLSRHAGRLTCDGAKKYGPPELFISLICFSLDLRLLCACARSSARSLETCSSIFCTLARKNSLSLSLPCACSALAL